MSPTTPLLRLPCVSQSLSFIFCSRFPSDLLASGLTPPLKFFSAWQSSPPGSGPAQLPFQPHYPHFPSGTWCANPKCNQSTNSQTPTAWNALSPSSRLSSTTTVRHFLYEACHSPGKVASCLLCHTIVSCPCPSSGPSHNSLLVCLPTTATTMLGDPGEQRSGPIHSSPGPNMQ